MAFQPYTLPSTPTNTGSGFQPFTTGNQVSKNPGYVAPKTIQQVQAPSKGFQIGDVVKQGENIVGGVIKAAENIFKPISLPGGLSFNLINSTPNIGLNNPIQKSTTPKSNDLPQTTKDVTSLGIDPLNLKADPSKAISDAWNSILTSVNQEKKNMQNFIEAKTTSSKIGTGLTATSGAANVVFSPLTALFTGAGQIPVLGSVAKLITLPFTVAAEGASTISGRIVDQLPVSTETKNNIKSGVQDIASLAAQFAAGEVLSPVKRGELIEKYGIKDTMTIEKEAQDLANKQSNQLKIGENTPEEIVNHLVNNDLIGTPEGQKMMKAALDAQREGKNVFISETPITQQLQDVQSLKTPDDEVLNPIIDQLNGIINENENNKGIQNPEDSNLQTTETQGVQNTSSQIKPNNQNGESKIPSQSETNIKPSTEGTSTTSTETSNTTNEPNTTNRTLGNGKSVSKLTSDIEERLNTQFKDIPGYEKMDMKKQAQKAVDLTLKDPELAKSVAMGEKSPPKGIEAGSIYTAVREKAFSEGDTQTLHDLAKTDLAGKAGQALKAYDTFSDDPVKAIKDIIEERTKKIEKRTDKSISDIQKEDAKAVEEEVKSTIKKSNTKAKLADFIKQIQCN